MSFDDLMKENTKIYEELNANLDAYLRLIKGILSKEKITL